MGPSSAKTGSVCGISSTREGRPTLAKNLSLSKLARGLPSVQRCWFGSCPASREPNVLSDVSFDLRATEGGHVWANHLRAPLSSIESPPSSSRDLRQLQERCSGAITRA